MNAGHHPAEWTGSDAIAELSQSCHFVLETSPPDYVEKISQFLESSVGQSRRDAEANDSDSGDSLFLTQKSIPEAVRSRRRRHSTSKSDPASPKDLEDSDDSFSASCRERKRQTYRLPKYSFPFLTERKGKLKSNRLCVQQNTSLHNSAMGGFFKCVRELWESYQRGDNLVSSLPTVDVDGEEIPPLSEGEEEKSDDEDIKVVERKRLVVSSKAKRPKPWNTPQKRHSQVKQHSKRRRASNASQEMSQGKRWKMLHKMPAEGPTPKVTLWSSDTESTDDGGSSCRVESRNIKSVRNIVAQADTPKRYPTRGSKRNLFHQNAEEEELRDGSDATSPVEYTQLDGEVSVTLTTDVSHLDDPSQTGQPEDECGSRESQDLLQSPPHLIRDTNVDESGVKKRKKKKGEHGGEEELPEAEHAATSENVEITDAQSPVQQAGDKLEMNENNQMENSLHDDNTLRQEEEGSVEDGVSEREIAPLKQKKKKRKKDKTAENSGQEDEGGHLECDVRIEEDSVFSVSCDVVSDETEKKKKKKKKRKRSTEHEEDVEQLSCGTVAEPLNDDAEIQKKKKKKKKEKRVVNAEEAPNSTLEQLEEKESCLENTAASPEMLDSSCAKRKKHKKKKESSCNEATQAEEEDGVDVNTSNDAATPAEKKKKKKKKTGFSMCDGIDTSSGEVADKTQEASGDKDADLVTKKKKKKKEKERTSEISSRHISEDTVAQSHDSVSVQEKKKKKASSFLAADAEGNCAQTHQDKSSPTQTVAVSAGAFETESAEMAGNLSVTESNDGVRKKKRKRKMSDKGQEQDFEEPNKTCPSDLPETSDAGVKRKKKRRREESEPVTPVESAADVVYSQIDEAVVLMKKKKKKKKKKIKENPPTDIEDAELEPSTLTSQEQKQSSSPLVPKGKYGDSAERSHDSRTSDQAAKETADVAAPELPGSQALNNVRDKKKKIKKKCTDDILPEEKSLAESVELEPHKHKKKEKKAKKERNHPTEVPRFISNSSILSDTDSASCFEMSSLDKISKNKHIKGKKRLYNPSADFLMG